MVAQINRRKTAHLAAFAAFLTCGVSLPAAASEVQEQYHRHTRECIRLFLSDKARHDAECLPNNSPGGFPYADSGSGSGVTVPVVEPEEPEEPEEELPGECPGGCPGGCPGFAV